MPCSLYSIYVDMDCVSLNITTVIFKADAIGRRRDRIKTDRYRKREDTGK